MNRMFSLRRDDDAERILGDLAVDVLVEQVMGCLRVVEKLLRP